MLEHMSARLLAHRLAGWQRRGHQPGHCGGQCIGIARARQKSRFPIHNHFAGSRNVGCDRGERASSGLKQDHGQPFEARCEHKSICGLHPAPHIRLEAHEPDSSRKTEPPRKRG